MKLILPCACISILILSCCVFSQAQASNQPIDTTLCELYQHPDQYAGKMIRVRGTIAGNDMWIDAFTEKPCPSSMSIVVVFPNQVKPAPDFDLVKDDSFNKFEEAMYLLQKVSAGCHERMHLTLKNETTRPHLAPRARYRAQRR